jgi:hypothetical protein
LRKILTRLHHACARASEKCFFIGPFKSPRNTHNKINFNFIAGAAPILAQVAPVALPALFCRGRCNSLLLASLLCAAAPRNSRLPQRLSSGQCHAAAAAYSISHLACTKSLCQRGYLIISKVCECPAPPRACAVCKPRPSLTYNCSPNASALLLHVARTRRERGVVYEFIIVL